MTAIEIIKHALGKANVIIEGQTPSDDESTIALEILNDWIASLITEGLDLEIAALELTDEVFLDDSELFAVKLNLTVLLGEHFKLPIPQAAQMRAEKLIGRLINASVVSKAKDQVIDSLLTDHNIANRC
jgi:hypothetical protein